MFYPNPTSGGELTWREGGEEAEFNAKMCVGFGGIFVTLGGKSIFSSVCFNFL